MRRLPECRIRLQPTRRAQRYDAGEGDSRRCEKRADVKGACTRSCASCSSSAIYARPACCVVASCCSESFIVWALFCYYSLTIACSPFFYSSISRRTSIDEGELTPYERDLLVEVEAGRLDLLLQAGDLGVELVLVGDGLEL